MTWVDLSSIAIDLLTLLFVARAVREIKTSLSDARHERLDINRRIEVLSRRVEKRETVMSEAASESSQPIG